MTVELWCEGWRRTEHIAETHRIGVANALARSPSNLSRWPLIRYSLSASLSLRYSLHVSRGDVGASNTLSFIPSGGAHRHRRGNSTGNEKAAKIETTSVSAEAAAGGYTDSVSALDAAKLWLENWLFWHHDCSSHPKALPTRLVNIGSSDYISLRLVENTQMDPELQYTALSHCWGEIPMPVKLLQRNFESFKKRIEFTQLSHSSRTPLKWCDISDSDISG